MRNKRLYSLLFLGVFSFIGFVAVSILFPPSYTIFIQRFPLSITLPFFLLFFSAFFGIVGFSLRSLLQGIMLGGFLTVALLLRFFGITHWFFFLLLLLFFIVLEIGLYQKS